MDCSQMGKNASINGVKHIAQIYFGDIRLDDSDEKSPGITVVDGEFYSLYPYKRSEGLYTLTHVKYTSLFQSESSKIMEQIMWPNICKLDL